MSNTKYRCAHEHKGHKRGEIITAEEYKNIEHPEYWVPIADDKQLKDMKQAREKMVHDKKIVNK